jgi:predicted dehydrogenase
MPGHTFLYSPPVVAVKDLIAEGALGDLYFGTMSRVNLGIHQRENNVIRDLAPHDFSILLFWFGEPRFVRAIGRETIVPGSLDVAFLDLGYDGGALVHVELSWLAPTKLRRTVLVGSGKMVVYEDTSTEQVRIYDRGVDYHEPHSFGEHHLAYRSGDVVTPRIDVNEPLRLELEDFAESIREGTQPRSSMDLGTRVVRMIEAAELSLQYNGAPVPVPDSEGSSRVLPDRRRSSRGMPVVPGVVPIDSAPPVDSLPPVGPVSGRS